MATRPTSASSRRAAPAAGLSVGSTASMRSHASSGAASIGGASSTSSNPGVHGVHQQAVLPHHHQHHVESLPSASIGMDSLASELTGLRQSSLASDSYPYHTAPGAGAAAGGAAGGGGGGGYVPDDVDSVDDSGEVVEAVDLPADCPLSVATLKAMTGQEDLAAVTEVEGIFMSITELADLEHVPALSSLTLIDTRLRIISNLAPVAASLVRLCLTDQPLTKMENLCLPNLRELLLQNNAITRIEGLEGCPKLQRLWLHGNQISKIEGLQAVGDLRELTLDENRISRIENMEHLVSLQSLSLGGTRIADLADISKLQTLPLLQSLSFAHPHFSRAPVALMEGYRDIIVCTLKTLRTLDGDEITPKERVAAQDLFIQRALEFNRRITELVQENDRELLAIEARRQRNLLNAGTMRGDLLSSFGDLEAIVRSGRASVATEAARQQRVRDSNASALTAALDSIRRQHLAWAESRLAEERRALEDEDAVFAAIEARIHAEAQEASFAAQVTFTSKGSVVCQELSTHSPDFRFIWSHIQDSLAAQTKQEKCLRLLKSYKIANRTLERLFVTAGDTPQTIRLYLCASKEQTRCIVEHGFRTGYDLGHVLLFANPLHAVLAANQLRGVGGTETCTFALCRVATGIMLDVSGTDRVVRLEDIGTAAANISSGYHSLRVKVHVDDMHNAADALVLPIAFADRVLPEFLCVAAHVLPNDVVTRLAASAQSAAGSRTSHAGADSYEAALEAIIGDLVRPAAVRSMLRSIAPVLIGLCTQSVPADDKATLMSDMIGGADAQCSNMLKKFKQQVTEAISRHEEHVWREMDPETARRIHESEVEVKRLTAALSSLREEIDAEKAQQERILRELRASTMPTSASKAARSSSNPRRPVTSMGGR